MKSLAWVLIATTISYPSFSVPAYSESLNLQSYCQQLYGTNSNAILLDERDAYTWRCTQGEDMFDLSVEDACDMQYNPGYSASLGDRGDPYSWACY